MAIIDFAIVAVLPEEFEILLALFPNAKEVPGKFTWYRTRTQSHKGLNYELVFAHQFGMGPLDAHHLAESLIIRWDPAHILLVGIAGSFHDQVGLGDVIVSQQVFYFDPGKYADGKIKYRPEGYPCSVSLVRQVYAITVASKEFKAWQQAATQSAGKKAKKLGSKFLEENKRDPKLKIPKAKALAAAESALKAHAPKIHVGSLASGSKVIADPLMKAELLQLHGKLLGTEMEGAGILHAAFYYGDSPRSAIVLKGVSDSADANKAQLDGLDFWRKLAGENSVRLAMAVIQRGVFAPTFADQFTVDMSFADPAEVRQMIKTTTAEPAGLIGFPALVRPKGPLSGLSIRVTSSHKGRPINASEALLLGHRGGKSIKEDLAPGHPITFESDEAFDPKPISFYMLTMEPVDEIAVKVSGPGETVTHQWKL